VVLFWLLLGLAIAVYLAAVYKEDSLAPGEAETRAALQHLGPEYFVLNDLLLPSGGDPPTTQIDHVVVSKYGVFCVETKGFGGLILGNDRQRTWRSYQGKNFTKFQNPVHQNKWHLRALTILVSRLGLDVKVTSLVSFPNANSIEATSNEAFVGSARMVEVHIWDSNTQVLSESEVKLLVMEIENANITDPEIRGYHNLKVQAHVKRLRQNGLAPDDRY